MLISRRSNSWFSFTMFLHSFSSVGKSFSEMVSSLMIKNEQVESNPHSSGKKPNLKAHFLAIFMS